MQRAGRPMKLWPKGPRPTSNPVNPGKAATHCWNIAARRWIVGRGGEGIQRSRKPTPSVMKCASMLPGRSRRQRYWTVSVAPPNPATINWVGPQ